MDAGIEKFPSTSVIVPVLVDKILMDAPIIASPFLSETRPEIFVVWATTIETTKKNRTERKFYHKVFFKINFATIFNHNISGISFIHY